MWELDCEECLVLKNWCFWTVVLEKTLESPLDCKEIQPVHSKGDQSWVFIGRTDVEAETPILWPPDVKSWLIWKDPDAGKDWGWCWERLRVGGDGDERGWDGRMASPTQWTWVWVNSGSWWWTGRPSVLQFMVSQRVRHYWATELNWIDMYIYIIALTYVIDIKHMLSIKYTCILYICWRIRKASGIILRTGGPVCESQSNGRRYEQALRRREPVLIFSDILFFSASQ